MAKYKKEKEEETAGVELDFERTGGKGKGWRVIFVDDCLLGEMVCWVTGVSGGRSA